MSLLPLWNNTLALALVLMTIALAASCLAAMLLRRSAAVKNSVLLPTLVIVFVIPLALVAARGSGWSIPLPLLRADPALTQAALEVRDGGAAGTPASANALTDIAPSADGTPPAGERDVLGAALPVVGWLLLVWAAGTAICLVRLGRSYHSLWRMLANARPVNHPRVVAAAAEAASSLGLTSYPALLETSRVSSPVAVGTPRHGWVIYPPDSLEHLTHDQLVHVLTHEGAHVVHWDSALRFLQGLGAALWWWHPLVHVLNRQLSRTREELCDNAVLSSADPVQYGQTLLEIGRSPAGPRSPKLAVGLFPEHERLEERIRSLLNPRRSIMHRSKPSVLLAVCVAGVATTALAGATKVTAAKPRLPSLSSAMWNTSADRTLAREYALTFDDRSRPGHLDIDIKAGDIFVTAYDGDELLVRLSVPKRAPGHDAEVDDGFRSVTAQPLDFEVRQNGNTIELDANDYAQVTHVEALVPRAIDLTLDSYSGGLIRVVGVEGHIRARSNQNDIILAGIAGSADVYGYNGSFTASFYEVTGDLEFETYNGHIDLVLPADIRTTTNIRAERQDVRSQFTIVERPAEMIVDEREDGTRSIDFGDYVVGDINGGGARTVIETTNGSVTLRKP